MGFYNFIYKHAYPERYAENLRSIENPKQGFSNYAIFGDLLTINEAGVTVNEETSRTVAAVYAANKILSEDVASLPCKPYIRNGKTIEVARDHPIYDLLHFQPNTFMTPFVFFETAQTHLDLWGNFYARISRDGNGVPRELIPIHPSKVTAVIKNQLWYDVEGFKNLINARDMIHVVAFLDDAADYKGRSPILQGKDVIANSLAMQTFGNRFYGSGSNLSGVLQSDKSLSEDAVKRLRSAWTSEYAGVNKSHKIAVLEEGLKYTRMGVEPEAAQFLQSRAFAVQEIARWFRIPPHMLADLERATFSNIEHQSMSYVRQTLVPWLVRYEQEFAKKLLSPSERKTHFIKFSVEGLLRGDAKTRAEYHSSLFNIGAISQNEIREKEDMNPIENGDQYYVPLNMVNTKDTKNEQQGDEEL